jgi:hypothetical protein
MRTRCWRARQALQERFAALAGLAAENMGRTAGWRFHDLGRRIERAHDRGMPELTRTFASEAATADDLTTLLDLLRQPDQLSRTLPDRAFIGAGARSGGAGSVQSAQPRLSDRRIREHLAALPSLRDDGLEEEPGRARQRAGLHGRDDVKAESLSPATLLGMENRLMALSDAIASHASSCRERKRSALPA